MIKDEWRERNAEYWRLIVADTEYRGEVGANPEATGVFNSFLKYWLRENGKRRMTFHLVLEFKD